MNIAISNKDDRPIYEQITSKIKTMILSGELLAGEMLPSMRVLAKDLRISVITTKRAYEELEKEGFIVTVAGKGSYIAEHNTEILKEERLRSIEKKLGEVWEEATTFGINADEIKEMINIICMEDRK